MADATAFKGTLLHERLHAASRGLFWIGVVMSVLGVAAIVWPALSSLVAAVLVGWMLLVFGLIALLGSFIVYGTGPFFGALLVALLAMAAGAFCIANPREGELALTLVVAMIFMFQGAFEMIFAFEVRRFPGWVPMLVSAIISIVFAMIITLQWPDISRILLGILLGVNFISTGLGYISIARALDA